MRIEPVLLAVDWGSTTLRIVLIGGDGVKLDARARDAGLRSVKEAKFEEVFLATVGDWLAFDVPIVLSGMITSRQGWFETGYVPCPVGLQELADGLAEHRLANNRLLYFVPGVMQAEPFHDVIRGEEVQIVGSTDKRRTLCILPGTHSKWVDVVDGRIERFATFLTGELYEVLRNNSLVGAVMEGERYNLGWFEKGVEYGLADSAETGGLLRQIFGVRPLGLLGEVPARGLASYLSGLLIGAEIAGARQAMEPAHMVTVIGASNLMERYVQALALAGIDTRQGSEDAAAQGAFLIAQRRGLIC